MPARSPIRFRLCGVKAVQSETVSQTHPVVGWTKKMCPQRPNSKAALNSPFSAQSPSADQMSPRIKRSLPNAVKRPGRRRPVRSQSPFSGAVGWCLLLIAVTAGLAFAVVSDRYTFSLQSPVRIHFQSPLVIASKTTGEEAAAAQADQAGRRLTAYQQYACNKFGSACRVALAIQRAENPKELARSTTTTPTGRSIGAIFRSIRCI